MASGFISDDDIQKVREATDLAELVAERVQLKPKGRDLWGCCPLHNEKTPSFKVDPASQFWHCFGCDEGGDIFGFIMKLDGLSFPEAVRKLAERANIEIAEAPEQAAMKGRNARLKEACKAAEEFYHTQLMRGASPAHDAARKYLSSRGLGGSIPKEWMLGYAPGRGALVSELERRGFKAQEMIDANLAVVGKDGKLRDRFFDRVMFPIHDISGNCIAFGGRVLGDGNPKYLNTQETPIFHKSNVLYGLDKAKVAMSATGTAIVTEGYTDVIAMHEAGLANTVATLGTALTPNHIRQLARQAGRRIVYLFDGDEAGQRATERALQFIDESITPESGASKIDLCALSLPDGKDPAEFLASASPDEMKALVNTAKPLILYGIERRLERHDKSSAEDRARALTDALEVLVPIRGSILAKDYAAQVADMLGYRVDDVIDQLAKMKAPRTYAPKAPQGQGGAHDSGRTQGSAPSGGGAQLAADIAPTASGYAPSDGGTAGSSAAAPADAPRISAAEANRRSIERELLALCCQHPVDALSHAEELSRLKWHDAVHGALAQTLLGTLMEDLSTTPASLLQACVIAVPGSEGILTGSLSSSASTPSSRIAYMIEELEIADCEDEIASLRSSLADPAISTAPGGSDEGTGSADPVFERMISLQAKLAEMKRHHSSMV